MVMPGRLNFWSEPRSSPAMFIALITLLAVGTAFLFVAFPLMFNQPTQVWLGDGIFNSKIALNDESRTKGLSGVTELNPDQALLMAFPSEGKWGIWMKDMNMPIDIVWLNKDKKVVYIVKNAPTDDQTKIYTPTKVAQFVVELPAGTVDSRSIETNKLAVFQLNMGDVK